MNIFKRWKITIFSDFFALKSFTMCSLYAQILSQKNVCFCLFDIFSWNAVGLFFFMFSIVLSFFLKSTQCSAVALRFPLSGIMRMLTQRFISNSFAVFFFIFNLFCFLVFTQCLSLCCSFIRTWRVLLCTEMPYQFVSILVYNECRKFFYYK